MISLAFVIILDKITYRGDLILEQQSYWYSQPGLLKETLPGRRSKQQHTAESEARLDLAVCQWLYVCLSKPVCVYVCLYMLYSHSPEWCRHLGPHLSANIQSLEKKNNFYREGKPPVLWHRDVTTANIELLFWQVIPSVIGYFLKPVSVVINMSVNIHLTMMFFF